MPYVALVASETRGAAVLDSLDVDDVLRARVYTPAGLQFGARTPGEIALSILAQLVQERATAKAHAQAGVGPAPATPQPKTATDPVCGMSVPAVESSLHLEHEGELVWFCGSGCLRAFASNASAYAVS